MHRFSLILCTVGRRDEIGLFLDSLLLQQRHADCQVLLVDQNRDDRLVGLVADYAGRLSITHLRTETRGLSRARNVGLRHATGELVGFPDDDCAYPPGFLARVDRAFGDDPSLDAITGHPTADPDAVLADDWRAGTMELDRVRVMNRCQEFTIFVRGTSLGGVRFNDLLGVGAGTPWGSDEGPDFLVRLVDAGNRLVYHPRLLVYHPNKVLVITRPTLARAASYAPRPGRVLPAEQVPVAGRRQRRLPRVRRRRRPPGTVPPIPVGLLLGDRGRHAARAAHVPVRTGRIDRGVPHRAARPGPRSPRRGPCQRMTPPSRSRCPRCRLGRSCRC